MIENSVPKVLDVAGEGRYLRKGRYASYIKSTAGLEPRHAGYFRTASAEFSRSAERRRFVLERGRGSWKASLIALTSRADAPSKQWAQKGRWL